MLAVLHAELHGKLGSEARDAERREDILTSTAFGVLFAAGAWGVLIEWLKRARSVGRHVQLDVVVSDSQMYWFWPDLDGAEPDLVIRIGSLLLIVEVKYHSGKSGKDSSTAAAGAAERPDVKDQLVREWRACSREAALQNYPEELREAIRSCDRVLVYLVKRGRVVRERHAVEQSLTQEPDARMYVLTWEDLDEVLATQVGAPWMAELRRYLYRKRLAGFRGFQATIGATSTSPKLLAYRYTLMRSGADLAGAFASDALPSLKQLASRRDRESRTTLTPGWARITGAHHEGIEAENAVNGTVRGPQKVVSATQHPDGTLDAVVEVPYTYPDGKVVITTLTIVKNDVTKSEDKITAPGKTK